MAKKEYPVNTKFLNYFLTVENNCLFIRRIALLPDGTKRQLRLDRSKYAHLGQSREALQAFIDRLNYGVNLKKLKDQEVKTAFISNQLMDSFKAKLQTEIPSTKDFNYIYNTVFKKYFLGYFINKRKILDPKEWIKKQDDWGSALISKAINPKHNIFQEKVSAKTIRATIQVANRFMSFLHLQMPEEYPASEFQPIGKSALKTYTAELKMEKGDDPVGRYIEDKDWAIIDEHLPVRFGCFVRLMYHYGLRRAESMGFDSTSSVKREVLKITKQLKSMPGGTPQYSILKDKEERLTPHWFGRPDLAHKWINQGLDKKMHPDYFSDLWDRFIKGLNMNYEFHDFRRTFITKALRKYPARDVQLAVGHSNLATTMGYAQDDRALDDSEWEPAS